MTVHSTPEINLTPPDVAAVQQTIQHHFPGLWPAVDLGLSVCASLLLADNVNPVALIYVGGPSSSRTPVADMFADHSLTYVSDNCTPAAFVSHATNISRGDLETVDLLPRIQHLEPGSTKNDDGRVVYLTAELKSLLAAQLERVRALKREMGRILVPLFPHLKGRHKVQRIQDFKKAWKAACEKAGCLRMLRHDFRRTAVRNMVNVGVPERVAMKVTGHKTRSVFDRYHIVSPANPQEVARKLTGTIGQTGLDANGVTM
jgi:hypothetical protein